MLGTELPREEALPTTKHFDLHTSAEELSLRNCCAFALAIHRGTGLRIFELVEGKKILHIVVYRPDKKYQSLYGVFTEEECRTKLFTVPPYEFRLTTERSLLQIVPVEESEIRHALQIARLIHPDLPWKKKKT